MNHTRVADNNELEEVVVLVHQEGGKVTCRCKREGGGGGGERELQRDYKQRRVLLHESICSPEY